MVSLQLLENEKLKKLTAVCRFVASPSKLVVCTSMSCVWCFAYCFSSINKTVTCFITFICRRVYSISDCLDQWAMMS